MAGVQGAACLAHRITASMLDWACQACTRLALSLGAVQLPLEPLRPDLAAVVLTDRRARSQGWAGIETPSAAGHHRMLEPVKEAASQETDSQALEVARHQPLEVARGLQRPQEPVQHPLQKATATWLACLLAQMGVQRSGGRQRVRTVEGLAHEPCFE